MGPACMEHLSEEHLHANIAPTYRLEIHSDDESVGGKDEDDMPPLAWKATVATAASSARATDNEQAGLPGLDLKQMNADGPVTGVTKARHRIENKQRRIELQEAQLPQSHWMWHGGRFSIPTPKTRLVEYKGSMCPTGLALYHPAA